jgi:hypothetical protein
MYESTPVYSGGDSAAGFRLAPTAEYWRQLLRNRDVLPHHLVQYVYARPNKVVTQIGQLECFLSFTDWLGTGVAKEMAFGLRIYLPPH